MWYVCLNLDGFSLRSYSLKYFQEVGNKKVKCGKVEFFKICTFESSGRSFNNGGTLQMAHKYSFNNQSVPDILYLKDKVAIVAIFILYI